MTVALAAQAGGEILTDYYRQTVAVAAFAFAGLLMVVGMLTVGRLLRPTRPQSEKYVVYEAGSDPMGQFGQSNIRYYVFALLFVIFDIEAVFIFPWATNVEGFDTFGLVAVGAFVLVLLAGLLYDWKKGLLKWV